MMQSCASAAKLRSGGPILPIGMKAKGHVGNPPPRTIIGSRHKRTDKAETVGVPLASSIHCVGRKTTPSGTTPSRTSRHRAIRSLRAKATIMVPGFAYVAVTWQVAAEAVVPMNRAGGSGPGFRTQLLFFLDDLIPSVFGKPLLSDKPEVSQIAWH